LSLALEFDGFQVFSASNGLEAMEMLHRIPRPGLILLDLMMPVMDGWEFIHAVEKEHEFSDIPVAVITAFSNKGYVKGADAILQKPVELNELLQLARDYCRQGKTKNG
jgi:CheY-like chemotaxis protein